VYLLIKMVKIYIIIKQIKYIVLFELIFSFLYKPFLTSCISMGLFMISIFILLDACSIPTRRVHQELVFPRTLCHFLLFWEFVFCCYLIKLEKTEVAIKNGQSRDIGNIWHIRKRTKTSKTHCFMHVISSRTYILNWLLGVRLIFKAYPIPTIIIGGLFVETINNLRWIINWLSWHKYNLLCVHLRSKCNCIVIHIQI
jgi:hypothetical protein